MACSNTYYILENTGRAAPKRKGQTWEVCTSCLNKFARREGNFFYIKCGCEYRFVHAFTKDAPHFHNTDNRHYTDSHDRYLNLNLEGKFGLNPSSPFQKLTDGK